MAIGEVEHHGVAGIAARLLERAAHERLLVQLREHGVGRDHVRDQPCPLGRSDVPSKQIQRVEAVVQGREVERSQLVARSIEELREAAIESEVKMIACQMTMDVFGFKKEEFIDEAEIAGAAAFLEFAGDADVSLFI